MKENKSLRLIDATLPVVDARTVLLNLVSAKINFHSLQKFSDQVKFGYDKQQSEKRLHELKELEKELQDILDMAQKDELALVVKCNIEISFIPALEKSA